MKKLSIVLATLLVLALAVPTFAQDELSFKLTRMRDRLDYIIRSAGMSNDDTVEYLEDDIDIQMTFSKGELSVQLNVEFADNVMGNGFDSFHSGSPASVNSFLKTYFFKWSPAALADNEFTFRTGNYYGMEFGKLIQSYNGERRGGFDISWKMGNVNAVFEFHKVTEGNTNDEVEGDEHRIAGMFTMPIGEKFTVGAFGAFHFGSDLILEAATDTTPAVKGDKSYFLLSTELTGSVSETVSFYVEAGMASGTEDVDATTEMDLSGFYAMGGTELTVGKVTLGVEAGFGSGDDDAHDNENGAFLGATDFWVEGFMHDWYASINDGNGGINNLTYAKFTASTDLSDKVSLFGALSYLKPTEEFDGIDTYGMDSHFQFLYKFSSQVRWYVDLWYALPDENYAEDNKFWFTNRLQLSL